MTEKQTRIEQGLRPGRYCIARKGFEGHVRVLKVERSSADGRAVWVTWQRLEYQASGKHAPAGPHVIDQAETFAGWVAAWSDGLAWV